MTSPVRGPSHSVEVPTVEQSATDAVAADEARARMKSVFLAAFVFAALAWIGTLVTAIVSSESNGIVASWIAIFPTSFGSVGLMVLDPRRSAMKAFAIAMFAGFMGSVGLAFFFEGIWPSL